jgi:uncharacterized membrane protein YedE/YeeE
MQYMRSVQFIMDRANWLTNILLCGVCHIIPIIGQIVVQGYLFEVIESLHRDPEHKEYPDFDFNRFMEYLTRGVWPFLMALVVGLVIGVPLGLFAGCGMAIAIGIASATKSPAVIVIFYFLMILFAIAVGLLSVVVTWPATLQAGLQREFNVSAVIEFTKDFNKRVFKEMLLSALFVFAIALVAEFVGLLACVFGVLFTMTAVIFAQHHLFFQLYELYLERGGAPLSLAPGHPSRIQRDPDEPLYPDEDEGPDEPDDRIRRKR